ncbi:VPS4-associated protein 1 [Panaeolus papilionaceus]|nr:VPS4-associated protein 1 [Panaeolus papilionaceus]
MSFTNLYYKRTAGTPKACYVCYKPTTTVLATINTVDFLYTCPTHLVDPGFASLVSEPKATPAISAEEIAKVKAEWEEKQKKKAEKEKEKEKEKDEKDNSKDKDSDGEKKVASSSRTSASPALPSSAPATPSHERYALHRDFFAMRQSEHRRRRQTKQAKELAPRLPGAPTSGV